MPRVKVRLDYQSAHTHPTQDFLGRQRLEPVLHPMDTAIRGLRSREVANVHHDRNGIPTIAITVLTYLTDETGGPNGPSTAGETIFPTMPIAGCQADERQRLLSTYLHTNYDVKMRDLRSSHKLIESLETAPTLQPKVEAAHEHSDRKESAIIGRQTLPGLVDEMCRNSALLRTPRDTKRSKPNGRYLAVRPQRNLSLVIFHMLADGQEGEATVRGEAGEHWHAGCPCGGDKVIHLRFAILKSELVPGGQAGSIVYRAGP